MHQVVLLGNYLPRQCGIATFTADLANALTLVSPELIIDSVAMSDRPDYIYPERVRYEIEASNYAAYGLAANYINRFGYDLISVQHEYGIFGGEAGRHLMSLVREVKMPIVTTLHTVLRSPTPAQKAVMDELLQLSERVVVMSSGAVGLLVEVHGLSPEKIDLIPHGIPEISVEQGEAFRRTLGIAGPMILTFGLLSPDKGIQYVIEAMPKIVRAYPGATYVVVGATHPNIRAEAGEAYRTSLIALAHDLSVSQNVRFLDEFVPTEELVKYLGAMDIYVTPYLNPYQITSGTLAYSVGAGKAMISTPYTYAEEMLSEGRGILVPFRDGDAIAQAVLDLHKDPKARSEMGRRAAAFGKSMLWPEVGRKYMATFARAKKDSAERLRVLVQRPALQIESGQVLPPIRVEHFTCLSDDTGILQHATFTIPNRSEGYCVDDNARALMLTAFLENGAFLASDISLLQSRYLSFVLDAFNPTNGRFRNFMSYRREWLEAAGSEDSHGRSLYALGAMVHRCKHTSRRSAAKALFQLATPAMLAMSSLRTWAYGVLAAEEFLCAHPEDRDAAKLMHELAAKLFGQYKIHHSEEWPWFEQRLTYANARLPQALIVSGNRLKQPLLLDAGLRSLKWLTGIQTGPDGCCAPIGTNGFYAHGSDRNWFDQQPVEAAGTVSACISAHRATNCCAWLPEASRAFRWFLGDNMLAKPVCDKTTGGCHDGLHADRINLNQGAESTLSYLCALAEISEVLQPAPAFAVKKEAHEVR